MSRATRATAAIAAGGLVMMGLVVPAASAVPASVASASKAASAVPGSGFVRSIGTASALVARATGYDAVDPAAGYGTITGQVTVPAGSTLDWASIRISTLSGERVDDAYVDVSDGTFGVTSLDAGTYRLTAKGGTTTGKGVTGGPVDASVTLGALTSGVVVPLAMGPGGSGGTIAGTVTGPGGSALPPGTWGDIDAYDTSGVWVADGDPLADGSFEINGVPAGSYRVWVRFDGYAEEWWQDAPSKSAATLVTVANGATSTINPELNVGGTITGKVTGPGGVLLDNGGFVTVYDSDGERTKTSSINPFDGTFQIDRLAPGSYTVQFSTSDATYESEWWDNAGSAQAATPIQVVNGQTNANISASLALRATPGGSISGTITEAGGGPLDPGTTGTVVVVPKTVDGSGEDERFGSFTADGKFLVKGLEIGDYVVLISPETETYGAEWWQDSSTQATAKTVSVTSGGNAVINPQLDRAGLLTGTVAGPGGVPLLTGTQGSVNVYDSTGQYVREAEFDASGAFTVTGLAPGQYTVDFYTYSQDYLREWWQDAATRDTATTVSITSGGTTTINPRLDLAGSISGTVTGPDGASLLPGTYGMIVAYDSSGKEVGRVSFDQTYGAGQFRIGGLPSGEYKLRVISLSYRYRTQWWNRDLSAATADPVTVTTGQAPTGINPQLQSTTPPAPQPPAPEPPAPQPPAPQPPVVVPPVAPPPPASSVAVRAVSKGNKLFVDVNPDKGKGYWKFTVYRLKADGTTWAKTKTYKTSGSKETRTLNLKKGTYRVVVLPKYTLASSTSEQVYLRR